MPIKPQSPCLGCKDRVADPNCHSTCEKYIAYDNVNKALREERIRIADANWIQNSIELRRIDMYRKKMFCKSRRTKG